MFLHPFNLNEAKGCRLHYANEATMDQKVTTIKESLARDLEFWKIKRAVKQEILNSAYTPENIEHEVPKWLEQTGMADKLKNLIFLADKKAKTRTFRSKLEHPPLAMPEEPVEVVDAARRQWDVRLRYELRSVCAKQKRKLVQVREYRNQPEVEYLIRFVYTSEDLLETLIGIMNPNSSNTFSRNIGWGLIQIQLKTPSLVQLRKKYSQLQPNSRQVGIDDDVLGLEWFKNERIQTGTDLADSSYIPKLKNYAKTGTPPSLRPTLWSQILGVSTGPEEYQYFEHLLEQVQHWDIITDDLTRFDVQDAADHDEFFVFEEVLDEMMLAFSRDTQVSSMCSLSPSTATLSSMQSKYGANSNSTRPASSRRSRGSRKPIDIVPPCHVIPFHRQVMFAAPICYLYQKAEDAYFLFRAMYCRYFCRLHIISTGKDSILYLSKMFEDLLQSRAPQAFFHSVSLGVHPLSVVFPWIFSAFSGWLEVEQTLMLWDRLIAWDSIELVAVLAAAIWIFRQKSVLQATSAEEIQDTFREMVNMKVIPLLQHFLFSSAVNTERQAK